MQGKRLTNVCDLFRCACVFFLFKEIICYLLLKMASGKRQAIKQNYNNIISYIENVVNWLKLAMLKSN